MRDDEIYNYETFYESDFSSLNPYYGNFVGFRLSPEGLGAPTSIQTANQINEVVTRIREGMKTVEVGTVQQEVFDQIPEQQFKEIQALTALTGVKPSVHSPIIDPVGFGQKGWEGDIARENAEKQILEVVKRSHMLDPKGNIPVTIHSSAGIPGTEWTPDASKKPGEEGRFHEKKIAIINQETKEIGQTEEKRKFYVVPDIRGQTTEGEFVIGSGMKKEDWKQGRLITARKHAEDMNFSHWENQLTKFITEKKISEDLTRNMYETMAGSGLLEIGKKTSLTNEEAQQIGSVANQLDRVELLNRNNRLSFEEMFNNAFKYAKDEEEKTKLRELAEEWKKRYEEEIKNLISSVEPGKNINPLRKFAVDSNLFEEFATKFSVMTSSKPPEIYKPMEDFALEKAALTFGNVAFQAYKEFPESAPIISIENFMPGATFGCAGDMKKLVEASRQQFVNNAVRSGIKREFAETQAEKLIGVTWDVGHLNLLRKEGFSKQDLIEESKTIAPMVKHVHLTDNFGYSDAHLPPGMGNVPVKEIMQQLDKANFKGRQIVEAGGFVQHFKKSPHPYVLSAFGSPIYGAKMAPYWDQTAGMFGNYFSSPLAYLPERHFSMYGTGFSSLPAEVGGMIPGTQSRFSGTPND